MWYNKNCSSSLTSAKVKERRFFYETLAQKSSKTEKTKQKKQKEKRNETDEFYRHHH